MAPTLASRQQALRDHRVQKALRVPKVHRAKQVLTAFKGLRVLKEPKVHKDLRAKQALPAFRAHKVKRVKMVVELTS